MPLADSLGAFDELAKAGKIRAIGLSQFTAPRLSEAMQVAEKQGCTKPCALQTWYNMVEREKLEGTAARRGAANTAWASCRSTASPTASSPASTGRRTTSAKSVRGMRNVEYLEGRGHARARRARRDRGRNRRGAGDGRARLDHGPARNHRRRSPARPASIRLKELVAALTLELKPDQIERLNAASISSAAVLA